MSRNIQLGISKNLNRIRNERKWTQAEMAKLLGISQPTLSKIEEGNRSITGEQLVTLLQKFNLTLTDFLKIKPPSIEDEIQNALARVKTSELMENTKLLPSEKITTPEEMIIYTLLFSTSVRHLKTIAHIIAFSSTSIQYNKVLYELSKMGAGIKLFWLLNLVASCLKKRLHTPLPKQIRKTYFFSMEAIKNCLTLFEDRYDTSDDFFTNSEKILDKQDLLQSLKEAEKNV